MTSISVAASADTSSDDLAVAALIERAERARGDGDYRAGTVFAVRAAWLAEAAGDRPAQARALMSLANQRLRLGEQEGTVRACQDAIAALEHLGDLARVCDMLVLSALAYDDLGMHEEAFVALDRARTIAQELDDDTLLYWVHNRTGCVHGSMGNRELSAEYLMRALGLSDGLDVEARFCVLNNIGDNAVHRVAQLLRDGDETAAARVLSESLAYGAEAVQLARAAAHPYRESISLDNYGMLLALAGDYATAEQMIDESRTIAAVHGYRSLESSALQHTARIRRMQGRHDEAVTGLLAALEQALQAGEKPMAMEINLELSDAYQQVGDFAQALHRYREYHRLEREAHNDVAAARARMAAHFVDLENARLEADRARSEADWHRIRSDELEADRRQLQELVTLDPLTGLPNRRHAEAHLAELSSSSFGMAIADVDHFKTVNDRYGHPVGDKVLQRIAGLLRESVRETDMVARMGGEEFLIALDGGDPEEATTRCELLCARIAEYPWDTIRPGLQVTISIGVTRVPVGAVTAAALEFADRCLYEAKRTGRNRVVARTLPE